MHDFIGDMLTRIRNGQRAQLGAIFLHPLTPKFCIKILNILCSEGYIRGFHKVTTTKNKRNITSYCILLKYDSNGAPVINNIFRVSKVSRRIYLPIKALWKPKSTGGMFIISTTQGLLIDREARKQNLGGEIICGIY